MPNPSTERSLLDQALLAQQSTGQAAAESPRESPRRPGLWTRLSQAFCPHRAATAQRMTGLNGSAQVYERRCGRCGHHWLEVG